MRELVPLRKVCAIRLLAAAVDHRHKSPLIRVRIAQGKGDRKDLRAELPGKVNEGVFASDERPPFKDAELGIVVDTDTAAGVTYPEVTGVVSVVFGQRLRS
jgi:hypothetical protein